MALNQISTCTSKGKTAEYVQIKYICSDKFEIQEFPKEPKAAIMNLHVVFFSVIARTMFVDSRNN